MSCQRFELISTNENLIDLGLPKISEIINLMGIGILLNKRYDDFGSASWISITGSNKV